MVSVTKTQVVQTLVVGTALIAALAYVRFRARRRSRSRSVSLRDVFTKQEPNDARELELVQDIVYFDSAVQPKTPTKKADVLPHFKFQRTPRQDSQSDILVIGVCGGSGSGKTTLSRAIIAEFGEDRVTYLSHDFYYKDLTGLTLEQRAQHNFDHPDSLETDLMVRHLQELRAGHTVQIPVYDFTTHSRCKETIEMKPQNVILVEGILIFADQALADLMDIKIFVETAADIRLVRRLRRDMEERGRTAESVMNQYMKTVRPMHMMFVESSKRVADIIIPHGVNSVALDMILSRLDSFMQQQSSSSSVSDDSSTNEADEEPEPVTVAK